MALDIILKAELAHVLVGLVVAVVQTSAAGGHANQEHLDGALGAYRACALATGLYWPGILEGARLALGCELGALLDA